MSPVSTVLRRPAATLATLFLLSVTAAIPAQAEGTAAMRDALEAARREAAMLRGEIMTVQMPPDAAVHLNRRIDALEHLIQTLTNKIDTLDARQRELGREFERYKNDASFRLSQLEKAARTPAPPPAGREARPPERRADAAPPSRDAAPRREDAPRREGPVSGERAGNDRAGTDRAGSERAGERSPPATAAAREQYEYALGLLRRADYAGAEAVLLDFIKRHPNDALTANAYYWLGENYYAQGRFRDAAYQFADGFRKFSSHPKAQDSLFKLGLSLVRQNKTSEACTAFAEYRKRFPNGGMRREAEAELRRLRCPA